MFDFLDSLQGKFLFVALFFLILATIQANDAKKYIDKENDKNSADYRIKKIPEVPIGTFVFVIILLAVAIFFL